MAKVTISQGILRGKEAVSENGNKFYEFMSIPYAKPPVGELRFKSPQPPESWEGERDATAASIDNMTGVNLAAKAANFGCQVHTGDNMASQTNFVTGGISGSEDCLYLNVYTPVIPTSDTKPLPVMVYIHGGGFIYGSGIIKAEASPEFLVEQGVVVVTVNYRLGVLGFLSLDIPEAAGNMGLKDQVKALEWVQNNISKFGGDKDNVTIFGVSAGAASVEYQMLSPMSKGLFHKAILQSGSTLNDWAVAFEYDKLAQNLADKLGFKGDKNDKRALFEFFLKVPSKELTEAGFVVTETFTAKSIFFGFVPIVEKIKEGAFLTTSPYKLLNDGNFHKVPVIRGFCDKEGFLMNIMKPFAVNELIGHKRFVDFWSYELDPTDKEAYNKKFTDRYLATAKPEDDTDDFAVHFFGDLHFSAGSWLASGLFAKHGLTEYVYILTYDGGLNSFKKIFGLMKKGACHGDCVGYLFKSMLIQTTPSETDIQIRSNMTKMWTDFAKTGNPTPNGSPIEWPQFTEQSKSYVNINKEITIETNYFPEKMAIFEEIYQKYEK